MTILQFFPKHFNLLGINHNLSLSTEMIEIIKKSPEFMSRIDMIHCLLEKHDETKHLYSSLLEKYMETYFVT
jgi:hypothetical protein